MKLFGKCIEIEKCMNIGVVAYSRVRFAYVSRTGLLPSDPLALEIYISVDKIILWCHFCILIEKIRKNQEKTANIIKSQKNYVNLLK